jgi:hypothetical protein
MGTEISYTQEAEQWDMWFSWLAENFKANSLPLSSIKVIRFSVNPASLLCQIIDERWKSFDELASTSTCFLDFESSISEGTKLVDDCPKFVRVMKIELPSWVKQGKITVENEPID